LLCPTQLPSRPNAGIPRPINFVRFDGVRVDGVARDDRGPSFEILLDWAGAYDAAEAFVIAGVDYLGVIAHLSKFLFDCRAVRREAEDEYMSVGLCFCGFVRVLRALSRRLEGVLRHSFRRIVSGSSA